MIDVNDTLITWLKTSGELASLIEDRIYAVRLPINQKADVNIEKSLLLSCRGGPGNPNFPNLVVQSVQFNCYGEDSVEAWRVYRALHDWLFPVEHQNLWIGQSAWLLSSYPEVAGQDVVDQRTNWVYVLVFWRFHFRNDVS